MDINQIITLSSIISKHDDHVIKDQDDFINALEISSIDFNGYIFFISSGGSEEQFLNIFEQYKAPYYFIATEANNSLPAALEIVSFLRSKNLTYKLFHGTPSEVREQMLNSSDISNIFNFDFKPSKLLLNNERFGVIGKPSSWLIASYVDYQNVKEKLGASIIDISFEEFLNEINKVDNVDTTKFSNLVNKKISLNDIQSALKIYEALKKLIKKYSLTGLTVRCFDLLSSVTSTSCLAFALLNQEGINCSCEGDIPSLISMALLKRYFHQSSFQCNPSYVSLSDNFAYLAHCTLPLDMVSSFCLDTHFESGIGIGVHGEFNLDNVTIFKINADLTKFSVFAGKIEQNLYKSNLCRSQIKVHFDDDVKHVLSSPCGNHLLVIYGNKKEEIINLLSH